MMRVSKPLSSFLGASALAFGLGTLAAPPPAQAAEEFAIDLAHSNIVFLIDHLGYSRMIGQFQDFEGSFTFDEADVAKSTLSVAIRTASVDTETEKLIQAALEKLMDDRTSFVIAHRLSTVRNADRIYVLDQGEVAEQGTHDELIAKDGIYAMLCRQSLMA